MPYQPSYPYYNQMQNPYQPYIPNVPSPMTSPYQGNMSTPQYTPQPYQPQIPQAPQFVPVQIHGHTIKDEATEVPPNDIPMDGTVSLFPTEDYSCIFAKHWNKDGKITTTKYVPISADEDFTPTPGFEDEMRARMDELKDLLQKGNRYNGKPRYQNNQKKDDGQNG